MTSPTRAQIALAFVVLEALAVISWTASAAGAASVVLLVIATLQVVISSAYFMELGAAHPVLRVAGAVIVFFLALLCLGVAGDVALRQ